MNRVGFLGLLSFAAAIAGGAPANPLAPNSSQFWNQATTPASSGAASGAEEP